MAHEDAPSDELREYLSLYALDMLDGEDARIVAEHLAGGCAVCEAELQEIREAVTVYVSAFPAAEPPAGLRERVLAVARAESTEQVWKRWSAPISARLHVVRNGEGEWETVAPGVTAKQLYIDRERDSVTMMIRMQPGSSYVPHRHSGPEQCFVLEGDLFDGEQTFRAGDYQCAAPGSIHEVQSTVAGCTLLIVSSLRDELLA